MIAESLPELAAGRLVFHPQSVEGATYAHKIDKSEAAIDWSADAVAVRNRIHGLSPAPGAHSEIAIGGRLERVKILRAEVVERAGPPGAVVDPSMVVACGDKAIRVVAAQRPGKTAMRGAELMRGAKLDVGARFNPSAPPQSER